MSVIENKPISVRRDILPMGEIMVIDNNTVMHDKHLSFTCDIDGALTGTVRVGHGIGCYDSVHLEINPTHLRMISRYARVIEIETEHGLNISDYISVKVDCKYSSGDITVMTSSGMYKWENVAWSGRQGDVYAASDDTVLKNIKFNWSCDGYSRDIYLFGDSYFNTRDPGRWPYYLRADGYMNNFMSAYPGMAAARAIIDFKLSVERGTPKYAVWCMGMNNGDKDGKINESYLETTTEFLAICKEKGITPILSTIPSTPIVDNSHKNEWIRAQGVRYIDFAHAVGGDVYHEEYIGKDYIRPDGSPDKNITGYDWYADMLYGDLVHPAAKGAQALYMQVLVDFPEIMYR